MRGTLVALSVVQWTLAHLRWRWLNGVDRLRGRGTLQHKALRLQQAIRGIGRTGVKIGQQLAMRIDLMPLEFSLALGAMDDLHPAPDPATLRRRVEAAVGAPWQQVFADLDVVPFASRTAFSWHRATLHGGREVVVKVRRQGVRERLLADIVAVGWVTRALEWTTLWRPGFFASLRTELVDLAHNRLDLITQARQQTVFRKIARESGPRWVTAPKVHPRLSNHAVLVTDWVDGVPVHQVLAAVQAGHVEQLAAWGLDPRTVGRRLLHCAWWAAFEELFSVSGRAAHVVLVRPGNELVFVDFEDCFHLSTPHKRWFQEVLVRLDQGDVSGAATAMVQILSPLPFIDVFDFTKRLEAALWQELLALEDPDAEWWERTTIGLWRAVTTTARHDGVPIRQDVLQFMASMLSFDRTAAQLVPRLRLLRQFRRYRRKADARSARALRRRTERLDGDALQAAATARAVRLQEGLTRAALWVESTIDDLPVHHLALAGKAAYALSQGVRLTIVLALIAGTTALLRTGWLILQGGAIDPAAAMGWVVAHPVGLTVAGVLALLTVRRVLYRLDDKGAE